MQDDGERVSGVTFQIASSMHELRDTGPVSQRTVRETAKPGCVSPAPYHLRKDLYVRCVRPRMFFTRVERFDCRQCEGRFYVEVERSPDDVIQA